MSMGYDVAELLAEIKAKNEELASLVPNNFTVGEARLALSAVLYAPSSLTREPSAHAEAESISRKLQAVIAKYEAEAKERRGRALLIASLTDEEQQLILEHRAKK
jgi:hypothetical protein